MLEVHNMDKLRVGLKASVRALKDKQVDKLIVAKDAEVHVTRKILELATQDNIDIEYVETMKRLGHICKIDVGAAAAVIIK